MELSYIVNKKNVEVVKIFDNVSIRDTTMLGSLELDFSKYKKCLLVAYSTLNQAVEVSYMLGAKQSTFIFNGTEWVHTGIGGRSITLPIAGAPFRYNLNTFFTELNDVGIDKLVGLYKCAVAPTSGTFTLEVWGVVN